MDKEEAKKAILEEWRQLPLEQRSDSMILMFYSDLRQKRPELLDFEVEGEKWKVVHEWLLEDIRQEDEHQRDTNEEPLDFGAFKPYEEKSHAWSRKK